MNARTTRLAAALSATALLAAMAVPAPAQDANPEPVPAPHKAAPRKPPAPQKPKAPPAAAAKPEAIAVPVPKPADLQPLQHARNAGVTACLNSVAQASAAIVDAPHKAHSQWVTAAPDGHVFQSIAGLDYRNKTTPNAAAIVSATPTPGGGCDTTTVQVYPTARSCQQLQADLLKDGSPTDQLSGMPLIRSNSGFQHLLLPSPGNGCVIVAVGLGIGAAPAPEQAGPSPATAKPAAPQQAPAATAPAAARAPAR